MRGELRMKFFKPCPLCGSEELRLIEDVFGQQRIRCDDCGMETGRGTAAEIGKLWNDRVQAPGFIKAYCRGKLVLINPAHVRAVYHPEADDEEYPVLDIGDGAVYEVIAPEEIAKVSELMK